MEIQQVSEENAFAGELEMSKEIFLFKVNEHHTLLEENKWIVISSIIYSNEIENWVEIDYNFSCKPLILEVCQDSVNYLKEVVMKAERAQNMEDWKTILESTTDLTQSNSREKIHSEVFCSRGENLYFQMAHDTSDYFLRFPLRSKEELESTIWHLKKTIKMLEELEKCQT